MRTLIIILLFNLAYISIANAEDYSVFATLEHQEQTFPGNRHAPAKMPFISQEDAIFTISRIPKDSEVNVSFLNKEGDTLYNHIGTTSDGTLTIEVPASISEEIVQVILKVNNKTFIGYKQ